MDQTAPATINAGKAAPSNGLTRGGPAGKSGTVISLDKALFDAFISIDSNPDRKAKQQPSLLADTPLATSPADANNTPANRSQKAASSMPLPEKALPRQNLHNTEAKTPIPADSAAPNSTPNSLPEREESAPAHTAPNAETLQLLATALNDPTILEKLKKMLGLAEDTSPEATLQAVINVLQPQNTATANENLAALPTATMQEFMQLVASLLAAAQEKLEALERTLQEGLREIALTGLPAQNDEAVSQAVARNLAALTAWQKALAQAQNGDATGTNEIQADAEHTAQPEGARAAKSNADSANSLAIGGRAEATLTQSQASPAQSLPLLPTPLIGHQQKLPVASQHFISHSNLDVIARPLSAGTVAGHTLDGSQKLARAQARQPIALPQVYEQVSVKLNRMAKAGEKSLTVSLNPAELGRVEIKLDFGKDGAVQARLLIDNPQTFELLKQDAKALERALADAGLRLGQESLQFDLRHGGQHNHTFAEQMPNDMWQQASADLPLTSEEIIINVVPAALAANGRVDIQV